MSKKTPLFEAHLEANAKMVDFAGWQMPINYGSQIEEHKAVREKAGVFDVSHMGPVDVTGPDTIPYLRYVLANDVEKLKNPGDALYSCMLNENGGIIDDLIAYRFNDTYFRLIVNAGCRDKDFAWLKKQAEKFDVNLAWREGLCLIALQGPEAIADLKFPFSEKVSEEVSALKPFKSLILEDDIVIARTGYTGEAGVEMMLPDEKAIKVWHGLVSNGVKPCGLGARDTLRLEAGLNLYGNDMTEETTPLESNLSWTVSFKDDDRDFVGKAALEKQKEDGIKRMLTGLCLKERGVLRDHQKVKIEGVGEGEITSGSFSPTLGFSIAMARVPVCDVEEAMVERRGNWMPVEVVKPPFIKR